MPTITAMEFGANTCAVARASVRSGVVHVSAMEVLDPTAFPGSDAFSQGLRQARKALKLPRRVRAVVWGLPDGATRKDPAVAPIIQPLLNAGFRIERVVTPCNALGALARLRTPRLNAATCWLAINRDGVAVIAVRPGRLLYSKSFLWNSSMGATGSQARLLQRYSLVSVLAPEVKRAMNAARDEGTPVEGIVTCGNLPDLRSLTMPLIEELDVEVETLDSLEGLVVKPGAGAAIGDSVAAIRIACGAATARGTRPLWPARPSKMRRVAVPAAAVVATVAAGMLAYAWLFHPAVPAPPSRQAAAVKRTGVRAPGSPHAPAAASHGTGAGPGRQSEAVASRNSQAVTKSPAPAAPTAAPPPVRMQQPTAPNTASSALKPQPSAAEPRPPAQGAQSSALKPQPSASKPLSPAPNAQPAIRTPQLATRSLEPTRTPGSGNPGSSDLRPTASVLPPKQVPPLPVPHPRQPASSAVAPAEEAPPPVAGTRAPSVAPPAALNAPVPRADRSKAGQAARPRPQPSLLTDPLPRVTAILVANDRRFATIDDGHIITIGDVIGRRTVVAIDERSVVLREPSGVQIRVGLGGRLEGVVRTP